jgi:Asp-tRNA(Asn)/Glu-tRNA(Gln) amidotransferase A subunit family amidase
MDISLLYILLRNITGIPPHANGWGFDPDPTDRSLSANIERIRSIRNQVVHCSVPNMSNSDFLSIWSTIRSTMGDVDSFLTNGNKYAGAVDLLRHETMDPEQNNSYEEKLRKQAEEDETTREMVVDLKSRSKVTQLDMIYYCITITIRHIVVSFKSTCVSQRLRVLF